LGDSENYIRERNELVVYTFIDYYRAMLCISAVYAGMLCLSVCLSVTFVDHVKTNKHIFEIFSPSGSHTILVFHTKRGGANPTGTPLTGATNARGYEKMTIFDQYLALSHKRL